ncbi:hypothetical protein ACNFJ7_02195 [Sphingomonas sp. HT-1]|uniref:hypothetical protein n=1 Tax=unclassified Sphingomonas TaxID=196159 RepID=UPI0002D78FF5|nr:MULTISPECIES: hypothetical protein [unclassified Sphingomonas]KTF70701.1 hypothetical protein ATB93_18790 [Sphingomonas sp. WG]
MKIDNGRRAQLEIAGVFSGVAGVQGNRVSFLPNRSTARPESVKGGMLGGQPVRLTTTKDPSGPFYTARFEVIE